MPHKPFSCALRSFVGCNGMFSPAPWSAPVGGRGRADVACARRSCFAFSAATVIYLASQDASHSVSFRLGLLMTPS